jgi:hypothetical protein
MFGGSYMVFEKHTLSTGRVGGWEIGSQGSWRGVRRGPVARYSQTEVAIAPGS